MKYRFKLIFFLTGIAIVYTSCIKWFGHPKPIDNSEAINVNASRRVSSCFANILEGAFGGVNLDNGLHFKPNFGVNDLNGPIPVGINSKNTCGAAIDTTFTYSGLLFGAQFDSKLKYKESTICINNIVYGHHVTDTLEVPTSTPTSAYTTKLGEDIISQTLSTTDTSELTLSGNINYNITTQTTPSSGPGYSEVYNFKLNSVVLNPSNKELVDGTATFQVKFYTDAPVTGTIGFLGNHTYKFTIGGKVYIFNMATNEVNGKP